MKIYNSYIIIILSFLTISCGQSNKNDQVAVKDLNVEQANKVNQKKGRNISCLDTSHLSLQNIKYVNKILFSQNLLQQ